MGFVLQLKSCLCVLLRRARQLCHHKCFLQKWWRGKSPNHAIVRSPGHEQRQVPTVTAKNGGLSKIAAQSPQSLLWFPKAYLISDDNFKVATSGNCIAKWHPHSAPISKALRLAEEMRTKRCGGAVP